MEVYQSDLNIYTSIDQSIHLFFQVGEVYSYQSDVNIYPSIYKAYINLYIYIFKVEVYQSDFNAEREARERIAGEKADLLEELNKLKQAGIFPIITTWATITKLLLQLYSSAGVWIWNSSWTMKLNFLEYKIQLFWSY